jgi:hypothetical protein
MNFEPERKHQNLKKNLKFSKAIQFIKIFPKKLDFHKKI